MKKSNLKFVGIMLVVVLVCAELFARYYLGLGTPPLFIAHPTIEYMLKPNQDVKRFGNRFLVNQYGMRSGNFEQRKSNINEIRVLIFGDSIVNGGSLTSHDALATTILQSRWQQKTGQPVIVANISAGRWGPGNWLAYAREYGFFDANIVVIVVSSHDAYDAPSFEPLYPSYFPTHPPKSALIEGVERYLPRYLPPWLIENNEPKAEIVSQPQNKASLDDLQKLISLARQEVGKVIVFLHPTKLEAETGNMEIGYPEILAMLKTENVPYVSMQAIFHKQGAKFDLYRENDKIHPNQAGQKLIAESIENAIPQTWLMPSKLATQ
jgi:lysophospholipase L1-like esterase